MHIFDNNIITIIVDIPNVLNPLIMYLYSKINVEKILYLLVFLSFISSFFILLVSYNKAIV